MRYFLTLYQLSFQKPREIVTKMYKWVYIFFFKS